jgi:hypothetical protein
MSEKYDLEQDLEEQRLRMVETERRIKMQKEFKLTESLVESLSNLQEIRRDINDSRVERLENKKLCESIDTQLTTVIQLLTQYVADNRKAVDGINTYLQDWKRD